MSENSCGFFQKMLFLAKCHRRKDLHRVRQGNFFYLSCSNFIWFQTLREPLVLRYNLPDPSVWITAATAFSEISKISFAVVRENISYFDELWNPFADTLNNFIFCKNRGQPFHADERRRYEFHDCQMVEIVRQEILKFANKFPWNFMQKIIEILNRASIVTADHSDVMGKLSFISLSLTIASTIELIQKLLWYRVYF